MQLIHFVISAFRDIAITIEVGCVDTNVFHILTIECMALATNLQIQFECVLIMTLNAREKILPTHITSLIGLSLVFVGTLCLGPKGCCSRDGMTIDEVQVCAGSIII